VRNTGCEVHHYAIFSTIRLPQHCFLRNPQSMFLPQSEKPSFAPIQHNWQNYSSVYFNLCYLNIHSNILPSASMSSECSLPFLFSRPKFHVHIWFWQCVLYALLTSSFLTWSLWQYLVGRTCYALFQRDKMLSVFFVADYRGSIGGGQLQRFNTWQASSYPYNSSYNPSGWVSTPLRFVLYTALQTERTYEASVAFYIYKDKR
jgi:hypothetical protein